MPRAGEGKSIKVEPRVHGRLVAMKRGSMTVSDVIESLLIFYDGETDKTQNKTSHNSIDLGKNNARNNILVRAVGRLFNH